MLSDDGGAAETVRGGCGGDVLVGRRRGGTAEGGAGEVGVEEPEDGAEVGGLGPIFLGVRGVVRGGGGGVGGFFFDAP